MNRYVKFIIIFFILIVLDISLKYYVHHHVAKMSWLYPFFPYGGIGIFKDFLGISFSINYVENTGAAWGLLAKYPSTLFAIRIVIVVGLVIYLAKFNLDKVKDLPLLLIITGALGNIIDFILYRKVIDMFHFNFWGYSYPIFNLADAMITIGIIWLFITFFKKKPKKA